MDVRPADKDLAFRGLVHASKDMQQGRFSAAGLTDYGQRFATWLMHRELLSGTDWNGELSLSEIKPPKFMIGKSLVDLALPKKYGIIVAAVRRNGKLCRPDPELPVEQDDVLFIVSDESAIARLSEVR